MFRIELASGDLTPSAEWGLIWVPYICLKARFKTRSTLTILPPKGFGLIACHLHLDHIIFDNEQQR
jgi:hypothetical protein